MNDKHKPVEICEVGMRDGLQSIASIMPTAAKCQWITAAYQAGMRHLEVGSFVSPRLLPQLADTAELVRHARTLSGLRIAALAPNLKGVANACSAGVHLLTLPISMTEAHSQSNLRKSRDEVLTEVDRIMRQLSGTPAASRPIVEASLSMAFGCSQQGNVPEDEVIGISARLLELGVDRIRPADTIGYGNPAQLRRLVRRLHGEFGRERIIGVHLHNSRGQGLAMVVAALEEGISSFDASLGGLGGCPFAPGASGNIVTEDLAWMLAEMGYTTGIDIRALLEIRSQVQAALPKETLYGFLAGAGLPKA